MHSLFSLECPNLVFGLMPESETLNTLSSPFLAILGNTEGKKIILDFISTINTVTEFLLFEGEMKHHNGYQSMFI